MARSLILLSGLMISLLIAAPASAQTKTTPSSDQPILTASKPSATPVENIADDYKLGAGDKLRIIVFGEDALTGEFFVSGAGKIAFPLIGDLDVGGQTIRGLQALITSRLAEGYLKDPRVSAEVLNYRPFYILGEVGKPGEYPYTSGLTVMNAVATAQGFTYRANTRRVLIKRAGAPGEKSYTLDSATPVEPGDTVRIVERHF